MKYLYGLVVIFVIFLSINADAQNSKIGLNVTGGIGIVPAYFNEGSGFILGVHPLFHQ